MALYALGDLHLALQVNKPMDAFGEVWINHPQKIIEHVNAIVTPDDTLVLTGDHSWGRNLEECREDLAFIERLPGRKILLRGNHDMFWQANKTRKLNELFAGRLFFLQNNFAVYEDYALVGTKGYTFEGPFYVNQNGEVVGYDPQKEAHAKKLIHREIERLKLSISQAKAAGYTKMLLFLHYPPTSIMEKTSAFTRLAKEEGIHTVVYSHCHGKARFHDSLLGEVEGITYHLVSGDYLDFHPLCLLP